MKIGVAGHRILMEFPVLEQAADKVFERLAELDGREEWEVLSSLAEGADRLLVARAIGIHPRTRLTAVLPLPADTYRADFKDPESEARFDQWLRKSQRVITLPPAESRTGAYLAAGLWVVEHCDVLIALWDGQPPLGEGSTAQVTARARALGKPLAIIRAGNRRPGTRTPTSLGSRQGQVVFENFERFEENRETN